jgi:hypothetical protein
VTLCLHTRSKGHGAGQVRQKDGDGSIQ